VRFNKLEGDHRHYWISEIEKSILENLLHHYPVLDPGYQQISRFMESELSEEPQELLEECMTESQEESRKWIKMLLDPPSRLLFPTEGSSQWDLILSGEDYETLLQVLNDLRVGFWLELGSPEERSGLFSNSLHIFNRICCSDPKWRMKILMMNWILILIMMIIRTRLNSLINSAAQCITSSKVMSLYLLLHAPLNTAKMLDW
jgi:hypothetical protein